MSQFIVLNIIIRVLYITNTVTRFHSANLYGKSTTYNHKTNYYNTDARHVIEYEEVNLQPDLTYIEQPVMILDRKEQVLRNKIVKLVRVLWRNHNVEESTWELDSAMVEKYLHMFST